MNDGSHDGGRRDRPLGFARTVTPVGVLTLVARADRLAAVLWPDDDPRRVVLGPMREDPARAIIRETASQLEAYFAGERRSFDLDLDLRIVGTPFQQRVWSALREIPYGRTRTYGELAAYLGDVKQTRAVGAASGKNPLSIVAPCHRVIGASGKLVGFAGGLHVKARLLELESAHAQVPLFADVAPQPAAG